ncbi:hypothetical protein A2U01_0080894, partial [Trifolium medium]|nr:hypothetical protein [Trifolium medium]
MHELRRALGASPWALGAAAYVRVAR